MKLIDPDEIYFAACRIDPTYSGKSAHYEHVAFQQDVDQIKRIEAEPVKHAHWIKQKREVFKCSNCGNYLDFGGVNAGRGDASYCPSCGAKMQNIPMRKAPKRKVMFFQKDVKAKAHKERRGNPKLYF